MPYILSRTCAYIITDLRPEGMRRALGARPTDADGDGTPSISVWCGGPRTSLPVFRTMTTRRAVRLARWGYYIKKSLVQTERISGFGPSRRRHDSPIGQAYGGLRFIPIGLWNGDLLNYPPLTAKCRCSHGPRALPRMKTED